MEEYDKINVNNLICETLHPKNIIAKLYKTRFSKKEKNTIIKTLNDSIKKKDLISYKRILSNL